MTTNTSAYGLPVMSRSATELIGVSCCMVRRVWVSRPWRDSWLTPWGRAQLLVSQCRPGFAGFWCAGCGLAGQLAGGGLAACGDGGLMYPGRWAFSFTPGLGGTAPGTTIARWCGTGRWTRRGAGCGWPSWSRFTFHGAMPTSHNRCMRKSRWPAAVSSHHYLWRYSKQKTDGIDAGKPYLN